MSTPRTVQLANGVEISLDSNQTEDFRQPLLQFAIHDSSSDAAWKRGRRESWVVNLNMAEVAQLHAHLDEWLRQRR